MTNNILPNFFKADSRNDHDCIINENFIRYILKDDRKNCFYICSKFNGCEKDSMFKVCKNESFESWQRLNKFFY